MKIYKLQIINTEPVQIGENIDFFCDSHDSTKC